jgi:AraC-like DNA-binding protein
VPASSLIVSHQFNTDDLPEGDRFAAWASSTEHWTVRKLEPKRPFAVRARFWEVGPLVISEQRMSAIGFERTVQQVRSSDADQFHLAIMLEGVCTICDDHTPVDCDPGDVSMMDLTRAQKLHVTEQFSIAIQMPRYFLFERTVPVHVHGRLPRNASTRLFVDHMRALVRHLPEIEAVRAPTLAAVVRDLLAAALADMPASEGGRDRRLRARLKDHVERHASEALSVAEICNALSVSRSSLYRAFDGSGGVLAYARRCRLVALHRRLADPHESRTIEQLGYAHGFPDRSHLSALFGREFGYAPAELRTYAATQPVNPALPGSSQELFLEMLRALA